MTCEIAIMNLNAVALAADSAMTVRRWVNGKPVERYYKGSNKIFQLSNSHPVGLMVFSAANVQGVPWEVIVKEFRGQLGKTSNPSLDAYFEALVQFMRAHAQLFPPAFRVSRFVSDVENAAWGTLLAIGGRIGVAKPPADGDSAHTLNSALRAEIEKLLLVPLPDVFPRDSDTAALNVHRQAVEDACQGFVGQLRERGVLDAGWHVDIQLLAELGVRALYRRCENFLPETGFVIAGFGANDMFPTLAEYKCYGMILDEFFYTKGDKEAATVASPSVVKAFATTSMVETFLTGISGDVYASVSEGIDRCVKGLLAEVKQALDVAEIPNEMASIERHSQAFRDELLEETFGAHWRPLQQVVASLPVDEMATLAETLIMLESLKEKVTQPSESVGGPIDVAVITRGEGLIWVKRKHYFDAARNPRYLLRQQELY